MSTFGKYDFPFLWRKEISLEPTPPPRTPPRIFYYHHQDFMTFFSRDSPLGLYLALFLSFSSPLLMTSPGLRPVPHRPETFCHQLSQHAFRPVKTVERLKKTVKLPQLKIGSIFPNIIKYVFEISFTWHQSSTSLFVQQRFLC